MAHDKQPKYKTSKTKKKNKQQKMRQQTTARSEIEKEEKRNAPQQIKWKFVCVWKNQVKINWIELSAAAAARL